MPPKMKKRSTDWASREAQRRIAEAASAKAADLDLSRLVELAQLPRGIAGLTWLKSLRLDRNRIRDIRAIGALTALESLSLYDTQVSDLSPLAGLHSLRNLTLHRTQVTDLTPISELTALQSLTLHDTPIWNLAPIADLTRLQNLTLHGSRVSDLSPIARLVGLQDAAVVSHAAVGLDYQNTPISKIAPFDRLAQLEQPARTVETINELRRQQGLPTHAPGGYKSPANIENWPQRLVQLEQLSYGPTFEVSGDCLVIARSVDPSDERAARDPTTQQLHQQVREKARRFALSARGLDNQVGWRGIGASADRLLNYTDDDTLSIANRIGDVWSVVVELGSFLDLDNQLRANRGSYASPLDLEVRRAFADLIRTAAPWIRCSQQLESWTRSLAHF